MVLSQGNETSKIAKVRILVEQVIRGINFFKILATEMWISMLEIVDDIFCYVLQYEIITYLCTMTEKKNL